MSVEHPQMLPLRALTCAQVEKGDYLQLEVVLLLDLGSPEDLHQTSYNYQNHLKHQCLGLDRDKLRQ